MKNGKIFVDKSNNLVGLTYNPDIKIDYYTYIKKKLELGYHQFIVTSDMMIRIIERLCIYRDFEINKIELLEEDDNQQTILSEYIKLTKVNKVYFHKLMEELNFIRQESSVDIKRVSFRGKSKNGNFLRLYIQVNGIYGVDDEFFKEETEEIIKILRGYIDNE